MARRVALVGLLALALGGCASAAALVEALAKDPNSACVLVGTPYGQVSLVRAAPGMKVVLGAGSCTVEPGAK